MHDHHLRGPSPFAKVGGCQKQANWIVLVVPVISLRVAGFGDLFGAWKKEVKKSCLELPRTTSIQFPPKKPGSLHSTNHTPVPTPISPRNTAVALIPLVPASGRPRPPGKDQGSPNHPRSNPHLRTSYPPRAAVGFPKSLGLAASGVPQ